MHPDLETLVDLHRADLELRRFDSELAALPLKKAAIETQIVTERAALDAAKAELDSLAKNRKRLELEVQDFEAKRAKYKGQLGGVKTNKEYTALLHEIETVDHEVRAREDQILDAMEKVEGGQTRVKAGRGLVQGRRSPHVATRSRSSKASHRGEPEGEAPRPWRPPERQKITGRSSPDLLAEYTRILQMPRHRPLPRRKTGPAPCAT
jgi:predicted  nucleic acid-binding Zn-ribbon protein